MSHQEDSAIAAVKHEDKLGKIAMRIIAASILLAIIVTLCRRGHRQLPVRDLRLRRGDRAVRRLGAVGQVE